MFGKGVVERMVAIGQQITYAVKTVAARPALASETNRLNIRPDGARAHHRRVFRADVCAVETVGIIIPVSGTHSSTNRSSGLRPRG